MSIYPSAVGSNLYDVDGTTAKHTVGDVYQFHTDQGVVLARYMRNDQGASVPAGLVVNYGSSNGGFATDAVGDTMQYQQIAGVVCASATTGGHAWVAFRGPVTNAAQAVTMALSAATRMQWVDANGRFSTFTSTIGGGTVAASATARDYQNRAIGMLSASSTTGDSGTASNTPVFILWR